MAIEKIKIMGAVLELLSKQPIQPIHQENGPNGLNWQCCLAGSSKTVPRILIFSMTMGADYTFYLIFIKTCAPQFKWLNKSFLGSVLAVLKYRTNTTPQSLDLLKLSLFCEPGVLIDLQNCCIQYNLNCIPTKM